MNTRCPNKSRIRYLAFELINFDQECECKKLIPLNQGTQESLPHAVYPYSQVDTTPHNAKHKAKTGANRTGYC